MLHENNFFKLIIKLTDQGFKMKTPDPRDKMNVNRSTGLLIQDFKHSQTVRGFFTQQKYKFEKDLKFYCGIKEKKEFSLNCFVSRISRLPSLSALTSQPVQVGHAPSDGQTIQHFTVVM